MTIYQVVATFVVGSTGAEASNNYNENLFLKRENAEEKLQKMEKEGYYLSLEIKEIEIK